MFSLNKQTRKERKKKERKKERKTKLHPRVRATERTHIVVLEEAEHFQLTEDPLTGDEVLEDVGHLFEGHTFTVAGVSHRPERRGEERRGEERNRKRIRVGSSSVIPKWTLMFSSAGSDVLLLSSVLWNIASYKQSSGSFLLLIRDSSWEPRRALKSRIHRDATQVTALCQLGANDNSDNISRLIFHIGTRETTRRRKLSMRKPESNPAEITALVTTRCRRSEMSGS
ncbi:uncharacterized [Tachysurus ichikawai]